jgi:hypothetical protein
MRYSMMWILNACTKMPKGLLIILLIYSFTLCKFLIYEPPHLILSPRLKEHEYEHH